MTTLAQALADADFATEEVPLCLKGSLLRAWKKADLTLAAAQEVFNEAVDAKANTAGAAGARDAALAELQALEERMRDASVTFTLSGIPTSDWNAIMLSNPPREDIRGDQIYGYNTAAAFPQFVRACLVDPVMSDDEWDALMAKITDRQFDSLVRPTLALNREMDGSIPFSFAASEATRSSGETSPSPGALGSVPAASGAGRRPRAKKATRR